MELQITKPQRVCNPQPSSKSQPEPDPDVLELYIPSIEQRSIDRQARTSHRSTVREKITQGWDRTLKTPNVPKTNRKGIVGWQPKKLNQFKTNLKTPCFSVPKRPPPPIPPIIDIERPPLAISPIYDIPETSGITAERRQPPTTPAANTDPFSGVSNNWKRFYRTKNVFKETIIINVVKKVAFMKHVPSQQERRVDKPN